MFFAADVLQGCRAGGAAGRVVALRPPAPRAAAQRLCTRRAVHVKSIPALHGPGSSQRDDPTIPARTFCSPKAPRRRGARKTGELVCVFAPWRLCVKICCGLNVSGKIPKGFRPSAQRCHDERGATLGDESEIEINPNGVAARARRYRSQARWG